MIGGTCRKAVKVSIRMPRCQGVSHAVMSKGASRRRVSRSVERSRTNENDEVQREVGDG